MSNTANSSEPPPTNEMVPQGNGSLDIPPRVGGRATLVATDIFSMDDFFNTVRYGTPTHIGFIISKMPQDHVNQLDNQGFSAMHWAAKRGDIDIIQTLFDAGAKLDIPAAFVTQMLPIHWAASEGKIAVIKFLLEHRQNVNSLDANGCSPLLIAVQYGQTNTAIYLVKNGADITHKDVNGDTALHWASYKGYQELVGVLLHFSPIVMNQEDKFGQTPLHLAALRGHDLVVQFLMLDHKANHSIRDKKGYTPLELTMKKKQLRCEWMIRRILANNNTISLFLSLGLSRILDKQVLVNLIFGTEERDFSAWIWRVSLVSNLIASAMSVYFATSAVLSDMYLLHLANTALQFVWWILFLTLAFTTPITVQEFTVGRFRPEPAYSYEKALDLLGTDAALDEANLPALCHTCGVRRPLRSKHCKVSRQCVLKFDHFCPYVFNAVSRDSYKYFYSIVLLHEVAYWTFFSTCMIYWARQEVSTWFVVFLVYSVGMALMILSLAFYHTRLITTNMTTNEDLNRFKYAYMRNEFNMIHNPFDLGNPWNNLVDGMFPSKKLYFNRLDVMRDVRRAQCCSDESCQGHDSSNGSTSSLLLGGQDNSTSKVNSDLEEGGEAFFEEARRREH